MIRRFFYTLFLVLFAAGILITMLGTVVGIFDADAPLKLILSLFGYGLLCFILGAAGSILTLKPAE